MKINIPYHDKLTDSEVDHLKVRIDMIRMNMDELSSWEQDFIISVEDQLDLKRYLSVAQIEIIDKIYKEKA